MTILENMGNRPRVAVIGSGLAGLATAYLLRKEGCEVYLIEKSDKLGFHSASVEIPLTGEGSYTKAHSGQKEKVGMALMDGLNGQEKRKRRWIVDVPMRSFQGGYYPLLISLYRHLGLPLIPTYFNFSFSHLHGPAFGQGSTARTRTYFIHSGASGRSVPSLPSSQSRSYLSSLIYLLSTAFCFILLILLSFLSWHRVLPSLLGHSSTLHTLRDTLTPLPFFTRFIDDILIPVFSSVGTMTSLDVLRTPLPALLDYIHAGMGTAHYTLAEGFSAGSIAEMLVKPVRQQGPGYVKLGTTIRSMKWEEGVVEVKFEGGERVEMDKIVIATQASAAMILLGNLSPSLEVKEKKRVGGMLDALRQVDYRETIVVTHRDSSVLPPSHDVRTINFTLPLLHPIDTSFSTNSAQVPSLSFTPSSPSTSISSEPQTPISDEPLDSVVPYFEPSPEKIYTMGTHVIVPPKGCQGERTVYQTTNPVIPIESASVLGVATLERALPLRDPKTFGRLHPHSDNGVVFLAGSYSYPGIPLLEGCVGSAKRAAESVLGEREAGFFGGVDWDVGKGSLLGRIWRWRRSGITI